MSAMGDLTAKVQPIPGVVDSATAAFNGIVSEMSAAGTDVAKFQALLTDLQNTLPSLAAAIGANTCEAEGLIKELQPKPPSPPPAELAAASAPAKPKP